MHSEICVKEIRWVDVDWIHLAGDRDKWRSDAMNCSTAKAWGIAWLADELGALHESLSTVKTVRCVVASSHSKCFVNASEARPRHVQFYSELIFWALWPVKCL